MAAGSLFGEQDRACVSVLARGAVVVGELFVGLGVVGFGVSLQLGEPPGWGELGAEGAVGESVQPQVLGPVLGVVVQGCDGGAAQVKADARTLDGRKA